MRRYKIKFAFSQYETVDANNKQEAKDKYIENMKKVMARYGMDFNEDCIKAITIKCV